MMFSMMLMMMRVIFMVLAVVVPTRLRRKLLFSGAHSSSVRVVGTMALNVSKSINIYMFCTIMCFEQGGFGQRQPKTNEYENAAN